MQKEVPQPLSLSGSDSSCMTPDQRTNVLEEENQVEHLMGAKSFAITLNF